MTGSISDPKRAILAEAARIGFDAAGVTGADGDPRWTQGLETFLAAGHHGEMLWLAEKAKRRESPRALWPEARSVIMLGLNYGPKDDPLEATRHPDRAAISVYARNRDYHDVVKGKLKTLAGWIHRTFACDVKVFADTAPVMEKPLAERAGIGWAGKHTNLISRDFGSWLFLGAIFTTLELAPGSPHPDLCGSCRACLDACPTGALPDARRMDARLCISYLTIEHKGPVPEPLRPLLGNRIYGCDDCLAVCPWNKFAQEAREARLIARDDLKSPALADLVALDDASFRALFSGSPIKRIGRDRFVRNVLYAIGNSGDPALVERARPLLQDPSDIVRDAAAWALRQGSVPPFLPLPSPESV